MRVIKPVIQGEERIVEVEFNIFKFTNRIKPVDKKRVVIFTSFAEFGCEMVSSMYCIPKLLRQNAGKYTIVVGWYGRAYLYRHLVDEFWEVKEEYQWLRDYARAFHHESKNLSAVENKLEYFGNVITSATIGQLCVINKCLKCNRVTAYTDVSKVCRSCGSRMMDLGLFTDVKEAKKSAKRIPKPTAEKSLLSDSLAPPMSVGIFARARKTYGRNLQPEFYIKLINLLENLNYKPIWLGEKQNTLPCPVGHIIDFSRMPESRDLETTLAIVSKCVFTIQFWTASTRLAGIMGVPYILAESPDQIWGNGQEGYRRNLCDFGPSKLIVSHYLNAFNNNDGFLEVVEQAIGEVESGKYDDLFGQLETDIAAKCMKKDNAKRIGS
jgi:hypothetical protein